MPTSLARIPQLLLHAADGLGSGREAPSPRPFEALPDPDGRVPLATLVSVWRDLRTRHPDPALGLRLAKRIEVRSLGLVGYAMTFSRTLGDALDVLGRYHRIIREGVDCRIERDAEGATIVFSDPDTSGAVLRQQIDARLAGVLAACRQITGRRIVPKTVAFPYRRPRRLDAHRCIFATPRLRFGESCASLTLWAADLGHQLPAADETLAGYMERLAAEALRELGNPTTSSFVATVAEALQTVLRDAPPTIEAVGSILGISARTLQRRLQLEGTTFARLRQDLRRQHAELLLQNRRLTVEDVAIRIGYSEPSTFYRAFRRWRGVSPGAFRGRTTPRRDDA